MNPDHWQTTLKYVDDVNSGERHYIKNASSTFSQLRERRSIHASACQDSYDTIVKNASAIGMKVNPAKTQLICLSAAIHSEASSFINVDPTIRIDSQPSLVVLGLSLIHI